MSLHRLVYKYYYGNLPKGKYVIHHINGLKYDNRPENLIALNSIQEHRRIEKQLKELVSRLIVKGKIIFNRGNKRYELS